MKEELKIKVKQVIQLLDLLLMEEKFIAYHHIRKDYVDFSNLLNGKERLEDDDFDTIQNCMRLLLEAPPKNYELGMKILHVMDDIYKIRMLMAKLK